MPVEHFPLLHPAPTFVNELHLVPMATNEPSVNFCYNCIAVNRIDSVRSESTESVCATPIELVIELEVMPPAPVASLASVAHHPCMQLIVSNLSLFYSEIGYVVTKTMHNSAHLCSHAAVELHLLGRDAHLTPVSEIGGIPL